MSQKMLRIDLTELKTVRIRCKKCNKGVVEVPIERLNHALDHGECRFCNQVYFPTTGRDPLNDLKIALADLADKAADLGVEFELPSDGA